MQLTGRHFTVKINCATRAQLMGALRERLADRSGFALATINLDHVTKLERDAAFRDAYASQDLVVADGNPVVWMSQLAGQPVELLPGSELVEPIALLAAELSVPVALIGSTSDALEGAARTLRNQAPDLQFAMLNSPPFGFDPAGEDAQNLLKDVDTSGAGLVFLALGAPKQEQVAALGRQLAPNTGFVSVGAGLDFLSGHQTRAPLWVRKIAMEWLWRLANNPRRLLLRYTLCAMALPGLAIRALLLRFKAAR